MAEIAYKTLAAARRNYYAHKIVEAEKRGDKAEAEKLEKEFKAVAYKDIKKLNEQRAARENAIIL